MDSCGPEHSPEKREADCSAAVSAANNARLQCAVRCRIEPYLIKAAPRCGAVSGAPPAGLSLGRPARRARAGPAHASALLSRLIRRQAAIAVAVPLALCRAARSRAPRAGDPPT